MNHENSYRYWHPETDTDHWPEKFFTRIISALKEDFGRWNEFILSPRHVTPYPHGVIELMPCADQQHYAFKYVNGHPGNPLKGKLTVVAIGLLTHLRDIH